ncbi:uncharacterized protein [Triticum aestivum]|uniref:uncharacterized protein n=1 Tax=Triticum aestivum TaxID=4565 RepID=UPI001D02A141|nr:uncharacterized protein LOC123147177 [Triticum aestivum]
MLPPAPSLRHLPPDRCSLAVTSSKPKMKASPESLFGSSSPSGSKGSLSHRNQPWLPLALLTADTKTRSTPWEVSAVGDLRNIATSSLNLNSLKHSLDALHGDSACDLEASHSRISKRIKMQSWRRRSIGRCSRRLPIEEMKFAR